MQTKSQAPCIRGVGKKSGDGVFDEDGHGDGMYEHKVDEDMEASSEQSRVSSGDAALALRKPTFVSSTHLRAHETVLDLVCRLLLEKKTSPRDRTSSLIPFSA